MSTLDDIFADVLHIKPTPVKKSPPISPLAELQKALDVLTGTGGASYWRVDRRVRCTGSRWSGSYQNR